MTRAIQPFLDHVPLEFPVCPRGDLLECADAPIRTQFDGTSGMQSLMQAVQLTLLLEVPGEERDAAHLMIDDEGVHSEYAEPFDVLLDGGVLDAGRAIQADCRTGFITMAEILRRPATTDSNKKTPRVLRRAAGVCPCRPRPLFGGSKV